MINFLNMQWPILQIILPLLSALVIVIIPSIKAARIISIVTLLLSTTINIYGLNNIDDAVRYNLGGFNAPIGIEYRLDHLNQPILCFISLVTLFMLTILQPQIINQVEKYITSARRHLLYSIILLVYTGFSGMLATNDLFNLYVFLEIASLASYALISQGEDKRSLIGALDYLIMGTIGASLILIGVGMILTSTGSLNIDDIHIRLSGLYHSKIVILGLSFFICGCLLKIALLPLHFWMIRAYSFASPVSLSMLAGVSSIVGFYCLLRFIYFVIDYNALYAHFFGDIIKYLALAAIIISSYLALKSNNIRRIILYSAAAQIGYGVLLLTHPSPFMIAVAILSIITDSLIKISLFILLNPSLKTQEKPPKHSNRTSYLFLILVAFSALSNSSMPLTANFVNKINMLSAMLDAKEYVSFFVIIATSILALEYNYKIFKRLYNKHIQASYRDVLTLSIPSLATIVLMIYNEKLLQYIETFFKGIING